MMKAAIGLLMLAAGAPAAAAQVVVSPEPIYVNPVSYRGYSDLVLHNLGVRAAPGERLVLDSVTIDLIAAGETIETRRLSGQQMAEETGGLLDAPVASFIDAQLLTTDGLTGFFKAKTTAARSAQLDPETALVATRQYFATRRIPELIRVTAQGTDANGRPVTISASVPVRKHVSAIAYRAPLAGVWLMQAIPSLQSHHRLNAPSEYAVDFMKIDDQGRLHRGEILRADNYYGYGAPVLAAADGSVVRVVDGVVQDRAAATRREGETPQAAGQRIGAYNLERAKTDFVRGVAGNLVVIRHEKDGAVEYSSYGHLRQGIPVREGMIVKAGDIVGHVGDTGDSPTVHLHFQVNAGPDPFRSASLPVTFANLKAVGGNTDVGRFVVMAAPPAVVQGVR